jgi:hypothetical protein
MHILSVSPTSLEEHLTPLPEYILKEISLNMPWQKKNNKQIKKY